VEGKKTWENIPGIIPEKEIEKNSWQKKRKKSFTFKNKKSFSFMCLMKKKSF
jgi:hypothetical protein